MSELRPDSGHAGFVETQGAYLLKALPDDERVVFEDHLASCELCRADLSALQVAADALPYAVAPVAPPPELKDRVMAIVRSEADLLEAAGERADRSPRRRRWRLRGLGSGALMLRPAALALAAAAVLLAGGALGFLLDDGGEGDPTRTVAASFDPGVAPRAAGSLVVADDAATLRLARMPQAPSGRVWEVWVKRPGADPEPTAALFTVDRAGRAVVAVPADLRGAEAVLVTHERRGGSQVPTQEPAIQVALS